MNYYLSQMLSGHGCFRAYLYKFKYEEFPECLACVGILENAEYVFFTCPRFREQRKNVETAIDLKITPTNLTEAMLASKEGWKATTTLATKVLQDLRREEQKRTEIKKTTKGKKNAHIQKFSKIM